MTSNKMATKQDFFALKQHLILPTMSKQFPSGSRMLLTYN